MYSNPAAVTLLEQTARTVSTLTEKSVELKSVASLAGVDYDVAKALFVDRDGLLAGLRGYLNDRFALYVNKEISALGDDAPAIDRLQAAGRGYFAFSQEEKHNFGALINLSPTNTGESEAANFFEMSQRPTFQLAMGLTRQAIIDNGGEPDEWVTLISAATFLSTMHGFCHLATFGNIRRLSNAAKKQTLNAVMRTLVAGVTPVLSQGLTHIIAPTNFIGPLQLHEDVPAKDMPKSTDEEIIESLCRAAIELFNQGGLPLMTLRHAADQAEVNYSTANRLIDGDKGLHATLEEHLNNADQAFIGAQCYLVPEGSSSASYLKAIGYGYAAFAVSDPQAFFTLISVCSGSVVPGSVDGNIDTENMDAAFAFLMDIAQKTIAEGGGSDSQWDLYTQVITLWSAAHGLAHLFAAGALRYLDLEQKFSLLGPVFDIILRGVINVLDLKLPNLELVPVDGQKVAENGCE